MKVGDLIKDEFGSIGIVLEMRKMLKPASPLPDETMGAHVFVQFPTWSGWSIEWLFDVCREKRQGFSYIE